MIPSESPSSTSHNRGRNASENDGFLYQCRVSPKISARVGGNRNGGRNGFLRTVCVVRSYPGNETVVDLSDPPCVPVLITRTRKGSKASIKPYAG